MRWLEYSIMCRENAKYGDIKERYLWIDRSFRTLMKHYENERFCRNCKKNYCNAEDKYEKNYRIEACVNHNHKHWEADYEN
jgi:hypothetical protein